MNSRKIILLIIVFQLFYCLANAQIKLVGNITTSGVANYPTHIDSLSKGGYMSMPTIAARDLIPTLRRKYGMLVFVEADGVIYKLNAATLVNDWVALSLDGTTNAGNLTGTTLKSTVINSSLTSMGTIASLTTGAITNSGKLIVGASSAASTSAVLEASSTTQGFLPPRMTQAQRNAIVSPITGLMIFCTDNFGGEIEVFNGMNWVNMDGRSYYSTLSIGDYYQGGKIFYILVSGNTGYDANVQHGLIAATVDQGTGIQWYNGSYTTTGATGTAIGTGLDNTNKIIASQGNTGSYAAKLCRDFRGGGYTDWYLPSKDEIYELYLNRTAIGGFSDNYYWSSTETGFSPSLNYYYSAYDQRFSSGDQSAGPKELAEDVRAIRSF